MSAKVTLDGFAELRAALRQLPADLAQDAAEIVGRHAEAAGGAIRSAYATHQETGYLADHVTVAVTKSGVAAAGIVRSNAPHAALFEFGTGSLNVAHPGRDRQTKAGANRGSSPPHPTVIPIAQRERRAMNAELVDLVKRAGFDVTGTL